MGRDIAGTTWRCDVGTRAGCAVCVHVDQGVSGEHAGWRHGARGDARKVQTGIGHVKQGGTRARAVWRR
jgi:hypothetical protein